LGWGGKMTGHGFRAMAMTTILENLDIDKKVIKAQLSHLNLDKTDRSYDRSEYLDQRKMLMQTWSDYLYSIAA
jgi:integrase